MSYRGRGDFRFGGPQRFNSRGGYRGGNRGGNRGGYFGQRGPNPNKRFDSGPKQQQPNTKSEPAKTPSVTNQAEVKKEVPPTPVENVRQPSVSNGAPPQQQKTTPVAKSQESPKPIPTTSTPKPEASRDRPNFRQQAPQQNQNSNQKQFTPRQQQQQRAPERPKEQNTNVAMDTSQSQSQIQNQTQSNVFSELNITLDETREEKKFTGRCRLFIGNLPGDTTEEEFHKMFQKYGEINEVFLNKQRGFGFIRLDTRLHAETAKNELDGASFRNRIIRVRVAAHGAALKVKNLSPFVSNELLEEAFSMFGDVERAVVIVDERGKPTGEGIVEFARKPAAQQALTKIKQGVFLLTASTKPISVEPLEQKNEDDGLPEKNVTRNAQYYNEREAPPRFAQRNSFEYEWGLRWKQLAEDEANKRAQVEVNIKETREKMLEEIELARHDYHTMQMRQELLHRQEELKRLEDQRKEIEQRRQDLKRQREDRGGRMLPGGLDEGGMGQRMNPDMMRGRGENAQGQRGMPQEDMSLRENSEQFMSGGASGNRGTGGGLPPPPLPPPLLMDGTSSKGMMGQPASEMKSFKSRFDSPAGTRFEGGNRGGAAAQGGANFGGGGANPRPLMDEMREGDMHGERGDGFPQKRLRRN